MKKFNAKAINERLTELRIQYAGERGRSKFARDLNISPSTYSYYEQDRIPPIEVLIKVCELTSADIWWLLTGKIGSEKAQIGEKNREIIEKIDVLLNKNPHLREAVGAFMDLLADKTNLEQQIKDITPKSASDRPGWIPVLGRTAAGIVATWEQTLCGGDERAVTELDELVSRHLGKPIEKTIDGRVAIDLQKRVLLERLKNQQANVVQVAGGEDELVEFVQCDEIFKMFPDSFALRIDGDSMSPKINDGDIVIISRSVPAVDGQAGVAKVKGQIGVTCKLVRFEQDAVHLIPVNEKYDTKIIPKQDLLWALAVLCHIRGSGEQISS